MFFKVLLATTATLTVSACATLSPTTKSSPGLAAEPTQTLNMLTPERIAGSPSLNGPRPRSVKFSPDGNRLTFLKAREDDQQRLDLWAFDVSTGEAAMLVDSRLLDPDDTQLSEEEKALRERKRIAGTRGIVSYAWDKSGKNIIIPIGGDIFLATLEDGSVETRRITNTEGFEYNAAVSPAGGYVSYIRDGALFATAMQNGEESALSPLADPEKAFTYGVAEFVAQEEMSRYVGAWWSPGDKYMAYTRVDESPVDIIPLVEVNQQASTVIDKRYPRAGTPNAIVDLFVRNMETGEAVQVDLEASPDTYLARVNWVSKDALFVQRVNRDQTRLELLKVDPTTGDTELAYVEEQPRWINLSKDFRALSKGGFLWTTEETGYRHITLHNADGEKLRNVTSGDWVVSSIVAINEDQGEAFFTGYKDTPLEQGLYKVSFKPSGESSEAKPLPGTHCYDLTPMAKRVTRSCPPIERVTSEGGNWTVSMNKTASAFVGTFSSPDTPAQTALYRANGERITWIEENRLDEGHPYHPYLAAHVTPEFGTLETDNNVTLHWSMLKPPGFDPNKSYPAIVAVYGGPHVQRVKRQWSRLTDQLLAQNGYVVFRLDNRGTWNRGKAFEDAIYRQTGEVEVQDQLQGVEYLTSLPFIDANRIGIDGWSYGGYMALMATLKAPEGTFAAALSGAPVTDWKLYDTFYTERYMDTPQDNPDGYEKSSVFPYLENLSTPLLMIHGMADDNVTFDNSTRVYAELQKMNKSFEMMTYPGQRHGVRDKDMRVHLMHTRLNFFNKHLKPAGAD